MHIELIAYIYISPTHRLIAGVIILIIGQSVQVTDETRIYLVVPSLIRSYATHLSEGRILYIRNIVRLYIYILIDSYQPVAEQRLTALS